MITLETLASMKLELQKLRGFLNKENSLMEADLSKSLDILENKINYYSTNYSALKSLNERTLDDDKS